MRKLTTKQPHPKTYEDLSEEEKENYEIRRFKELKRGGQKEGASRRTRSSSLDPGFVGKSLYGAMVRKTNIETKRYLGFVTEL
jgi:hypothetical protein